MADIFLISSGVAPLYHVYRKDARWSHVPILGDNWREIVFVNIGVILTNWMLLNYPPTTGGKITRSSVQLAFFALTHCAQAHTSRSILALKLYE